MTSGDDLRREFGIDPSRLNEQPALRVRACFSLGTVIGQWIGTLLMCGLGTGMAFALWHLPAPVGLPAALLALTGMGWLIWLAVRNDFAWIELEDDVLRAQHLYTGRQVERELREIRELLPVILRPIPVEASIAVALLGRIKAIHVRFEDGRQPLPIQRSDPAMVDAQELIVALVVRMSQIAELETDVLLVDEKPLITRIGWKQAPG